MQQIPINIYKDSLSCIEEFDNYSWSKDKLTLEMLDTPDTKGFDHAIDATRYVAATKMGFSGEHPHC